MGRRIRAGVLVHRRTRAGVPAGRRGRADVMVCRRAQAGVAVDRWARADVAVCRRIRTGVAVYRWIRTGVLARRRARVGVLVCRWTRAGVPVRRQGHMGVPVPPSSRPRGRSPSTPGWWSGSGRTTCCIAFPSRGRRSCGPRGTGRARIRRCRCRFRQGVRPPSFPRARRNRSEWRPPRRPRGSGGRRDWSAGSAEDPYRPGRLPSPCVPWPRWPSYSPARRTVRPPRPGDGRDGVRRHRGRSRGLLADAGERGREVGPDHVRQRYRDRRRAGRALTDLRRHR